MKFSLLLPFLFVSSYGQQSVGVPDISSLSTIPSVQLINVTSISTLQTETPPSLTSPATDLPSVNLPSGSDLPPLPGVPSLSSGLSSQGNSIDSLSTQLANSSRLQMPSLPVGNQLPSLPAIPSTQSLSTVPSSQSAPPIPSMPPITYLLSAQAAPYAQSLPSLGSMIPANPSLPSVLAAPTAGSLPSVGSISAPPLSSGLSSQTNYFTSLLAQLPSSSGSQSPSLSSQLPSTPTVPSIPSNPALPSVPSIPSGPSIPSVPSVQSLPSLPSLPSVPLTPSLPSLPLLPAAMPYRNETIERPCEIFDIFCIRKYFSEHSNCKKRNGRVPEPFYRAQSPVYLVRVNLTVTSLNIRYRGLNGRIREFYVNKATDKLIMAIEFRNLAIDSDNTYFRFHRRGQEPTVTNDFLNVTYSSVESTIIIPNLKNLKLEESEVFTYVNDAIPSFSVGPNAFLSSDPNVARTLVEFLVGIPTNIREGDLTSGPFYPATFIQYTICDFGLQIL